VVGVAARLGDRLASARRGGFVGRRAERDLLHRVVAEDDAAVVFVQGPGGVGKTTLLREAAWLGEHSGRVVLWLDGRLDVATPAALLAQLAEVMGTGDADPLARLAATSRALVLVDNVDGLAPLSGWIREDALPRLSSDAVVVAAGRALPAARWRQDPGWRELVHDIRLDNLDAADGAELLRRRGVPDHRHAEALAFTHGHPLALALVADAYGERADALSPVDSPRMLSTLLARLIDALPGPDHRAALEVAAEVRAVTQPLLAATLDRPDTRDLFDWLGRLSMMESGPRGLHPHELAREVLSAELRWRDPQRYDEIHRAAGAYYRGQLDRPDPAARRAALLDYAFLHRGHGPMSAFLAPLAPDAPGLGGLTLGPLSDPDWPTARAWLAEHEGPESAGWADRWREEQPEAFTVVRDGTGSLVGWFCQLTLAPESPADPDPPDPALPRIRRYLREHAPLRPGERAFAVRFWLDRETYQAVSPTQTLMALHCGQVYLTTPGLAFTFQTYADPGFWAEASRYADMHRLPEADFTVGGRSYGVYGHDWRAVPPSAWLALLADRELATAPFAVAPPADTTTHVMDRAAFTVAVREALRTLHRPDRLRDSPLLRTRLVGARAGDGDRVVALREAVRAAAGVLEQSTADRRAFRALHHTYLRPAETQQHAADLLRLPMSTYRRHLAAGVDRLAELLWQEEITPGPRSSGQLDVREP
jgi:hypothetical protein